MSRGKREEISEKKLNIKKVFIVIIIFLIIIAGVIIGINKDKIFKIKDEKISGEEQIKSEEKEKTIEEILEEFGGQTIEQPKPDMYIVQKDDKVYTIYEDGEILEGKVSLWNGESKEPAVDEVGNYNIYTAEELKWISDKVSKGEKNFAGVTITMRANMDLGARQKEDGTWDVPYTWTPIIGFLDEIEKEEKKNENTTENAEAEQTPKENLKRFLGCFEGNGCSIRGVYTDSDKKYQGLFGFCAGTIQNLTLKNSYISGGIGTGGIVGLNGGTVLNCTVENTIINGKESKTGGVVGISMSGSNVKQCYTKFGTVTGKTYTGGVVGYVNNNSKIIECSNSANVKGEKYTGGIAGIAFYGTAIQLNSNEGMIEGEDFVGGIVGYSQAQTENSYNIGKVTGKNHVAGLMGVNYTMGDITKSYNVGTVTGESNVGGIAGTNNATISNCYNTGKISVSKYRAGGISGQNGTDSFIYTSYNVGKIEGQKNIGGICGGDFGTITNTYYLNSSVNIENSEQSKTEEEMKTNVVQNLGEEFTNDSNNKNNGYPILNWQS